MTLPEAVKTMPLAQKIKVGANRGTRYFYIGFADDLLKRMSFGNPELTEGLRGRRNPGSRSGR